MLDSLPTVSGSNGEVRLVDPDRRAEFSLKPANMVAAKRESGVVTTRSPGNSEVFAVSHVTANLTGQIVAVINDRSVTHFDFETNIPEGYDLETDGSGGYKLRATDGRVEGAVKAPWAADANGLRLQTHYELVGNGIIRQHIETREAKFPIVADPSWWWWAATRPLALLPSHRWLLVVEH